MDNLHQGHRSRMRNRMHLEGLDNCEAHRILEMVLYYSHVRKDTNEIGHLLIERFGSLAEVFDAPLEELLKVKGIGPVSAGLLKLIPEVARLYLSDKYSPGKVLDSTVKLGEFLRHRYVGKDNEIALLLCLDNTGKLLKCVQIAEGSIEEVPVPARRVAEEAMRVGCSVVVLAHNHPRGFAIPSKQDLVKTRELFLALRGIGINLIDHIIVARGEYYSMADAAILPVQE